MFPSANLMVSFNSTAIDLRFMWIRRLYFLCYSALEYLEDPLIGNVGHGEVLKSFFFNILADFPSIIR